jgi:hypothetical protein
MVISSNDKSDLFHSQMKVLNLKKENETKYRISMSGSDEIGTSKLDGLLMFRAEGMCFKLSKVYDNRKSNSIDLLLFEGSGNADKIEGEWAFKGFESNPKCSGTWTMVEA